MNLERFITPQQHTYRAALQEITAGRKTSHWMWFIFPQLQGLGFSDMAFKYGITNLSEAEAYYAHPVLGKRLVEISTALLESKMDNATLLMGSPDDLKLRSSMTLFNELANPNPVFQKVLDKFFNGQKDLRTLALLGEFD